MLISLITHLMNRLWIRLSLSYVVLLIVVPIGAIGSYLFLSGNKGAEIGGNGSPPLSDIGTIVLLSLTLGVLAGVFVSRNLGKQVTQLVKATQAITPQNLDYRVQVTGVKELQDLADSFNRMVDELDRSQQQRRNLLADVSHELLTPLTVLKGNLGAMLDGVYAMNEEEISHLFDQTHHIINLVKELRQLTQAEAQQLPLRLEPTSLNEIVDEMVLLFTPFATKREIALRQVVQPDLPLLDIDRQRMRQVLSNLLSNAFRHTPKGGRITIETAVIHKTVQISVQDSGEGLNESEVAHIFERFYRTDGTTRRDSGGSGLGLAIVKALVEAHGGTVWAESTKGEGATFTVSLPCDAFEG